MGCPAPFRHNVEFFILDDKQNSLSARLNSGNEEEGKQFLLMEELHYTLGQIKTNENTVQRCMSNKNNPAGSYLSSAGQDTVLRTWWTG